MTQVRCEGMPSSEPLASDVDDCPGPTRSRACSTSANASLLCMKTLDAPIAATEHGSLSSSTSCLR